MIKYFEGSVFNAGADAMVNAVNTVGVMGIGLALEFALRYPNMERDYQTKCKSQMLTTGRVDFVKSGETTIINFPTKAHWRDKSQIQWIEQGLIDFTKRYHEYGVTSVAFPKLGTGFGGLNWNDVHALMIKYLKPLDIDIIICLNTLEQPQGLEAEMVNYLNQMGEDELIDVLGINDAHKVYHNNLPVKRFAKLYNRRYILDKNAYRKLYHHIVAAIN